jgi:hypothetical protein
MHVQHNSHTKSFKKRSSSEAAVSVSSKSYYHFTLYRVRRFEALREINTLQLQNTNVETNCIIDYDGLWPLLGNASRFRIFPRKQGVDHSFYLNFELYSRRIFKKYWRWTPIFPYGEHILIIKSRAIQSNFQIIRGFCGRKERRTAALIKVKYFENIIKPSSFRTPKLRELKKFWMSTENKNVTMWTKINICTEGYVARCHHWSHFHAALMRSRRASWWGEKIDPPI